MVRAFPSLPFRHHVCAADATLSLIACTSTLRRVDATVDGCLSNAIRLRIANESGGAVYDFVDPAHVTTAGHHPTATYAA